MTEELPPDQRTEEDDTASPWGDPRLPEPRKPGTPDRAPGQAIAVRSGRPPVPAATRGPEPAATRAWAHDARTRVLLAIIALLVMTLLIVLVVVVIYPSGAGKTAQPAANSTAGKTAAPVARGTSSPSGDATTQAPASPAASGGPGDGAAGQTGAVTTVYRSVPVTFPPLTGFSAAELSLTPRPQVSLGSYGDPTTDLMYNPGTWESSDPIADLKAGAPSYSTCMTLVQRHPMNLADQSLIQGHGYCLQVSTNPDMIGYVKVISAPTGYVYNSPTITLSVTLWQSQE